MTSSSQTGSDRFRNRKSFWFRFGLCALSGIMLGFSFPPSSLGILACFGLVPWLIAMADTTNTRAALWFSYVSMAIFHIITLNWTGGYEHAKDPYMMIAGGLNMLVHPFFYFIPIGIFLYIRNSLGERIALVALPFLWVAYEYSHSLSEWSFPWLTIGNSQSYNTAIIQFISFTGIFGLSLWILFMNVLSYVLYSNLAQEKWRPLSKPSFGMTGLVVILYLVPKIYGEAVLGAAPPEGNGGLNAGERTVRIGMVQANVDPWLKWTKNGAETLGLYLSMTDSLLDTARVRPQIVLWPETAIPFRLLTPGQESVRDFLRYAVDSLQASLLTGFPHMLIYPDSAAAPGGAKRIQRTGARYDDFNASAFIQPGVKEIPWYGKMKMVPLAERIPYADFFHKLDFLRWGVGIGGWQIGRDSTIFVDERTGARFCSMICYESTYPALVAAFVKKGAEFISIITIDSWWGHMSGAFQHQQFAIFRAVENRRWIARCAVGGISCFIDPYGRVYDRTELFTVRTLSRTIGRSSDLTYYSEHGDWIAVLAVLFAALLFAAAIGQRFKDKQRRVLWKNT